MEVHEFFGEVPVLLLEVPEVEAGEPLERAEVATKRSLGDLPRFRVDGGLEGMLHPLGEFEGAALVFGTREVRRPKLDEAGGGAAGERHGAEA